MPHSIPSDYLLNHVTGQRKCYATLIFQDCPLHDRGQRCGTGTFTLSSVEVTQLSHKIITIQTCSSYSFDNGFEITGVWTSTWPTTTHP